ncbi:MAG: sigma-70 family RNA polymerase sigma factor [Cyanobacteria bacterium P01_F01_bin.150]
MPSKTPSDPDKADRIQEQLTALEKFVTDALGLKRDENQRQLLLFIKRTLLQFRLDQEYSPADILGESYFRIVVKIRSGEIVHNLPAFFNRTSFNVIREKNKTRSRKEKIDTRHIAINHEILYPNLELYSSQYKNEEVESLQIALNQMSQDDLDILILRIVKGLSWAEVRENYLENNQDISVASLRKRGNRALAKLRQSFFAVKQTGSS